MHDLTVPTSKPSDIGKDVYAFNATVYYVDKGNSKLNSAKSKLREAQISLVAQRSSVLKHDFFQKCFAEKSL